MAYINPIDIVIKENFDLSDKETRNFIVSLTEDEKSTVVTALAGALYDKIIEKVDDIDFGTIPKSKGDITRIDGYDNLVECVQLIKKLILEYKESTEVIDTVINAIENVKQRKSKFMQGFALKVQLPVMIYNLITLSIVHSVSYLIAVCIDYIKNPNTSWDIALSKTAYNNAHDNVLFEQLREFNAACGSGQLDTTLTEISTKKVYREAVFKENEEVIITPNDCQDGPCNPQIQTDIDIFKGQDDSEPAQIQPVIPEEDDVTIDIDDNEDDMTIDEPVFAEPSINEGVGDIISGTANIILAPIKGAAAGLKYAIKGAAFLVKSVIPFMRHLTYFFISSRVKISDALSLQAQLLEINAYKVKYDDNVDQDKREKIAQKQLKIASNLNKWANKIAIDNKTSAKKSEKMIEDENNKMKKSDIADQIPDEDKDILF